MNFKCMNNKRLLIICILCLFFSVNIFAQNQEENQYAPKGFDFFFNAGMYKGHKFNANYYQGDPNNDPDKLDRRYGDPDINYILNNKYWREEILNLVEDNNTGVIVDYNNFPNVSLSGMHYNLAFYFEVGARYRFNESFMLSILFGQTRLTASGTAYFYFQSTEHNPNPDGTRALEYPLMGKERRNFFQVQMTYLFHTTIPYIFPFVDLGVHLNSVKTISSELIIHDRYFDMINRYGEGYHYIPGDNAYEINPHIGGIGYGFMAGFGVRIAFNAWAALEPVVQISADKLNLSSYGKIRPNFNFMIRLVVGDRLFARKAK